MYDLKKSSSRSRKQENIVLASLIVILLICFGIIGFLFYKYFYAGAGNSKYGDRLDEISNYVLPDDLSSQISSLYTNEKSIDKVSVNVKGRIIYINMYFASAAKVDTVKTLATKALDKIGSENLTYYEVQFVIDYTGEEENSNFPIFGSKSVNNTKVVWSK